MAGHPITRNGGAVHPIRPAGGVNGAAVTVTGICQKPGATVDFAWSANQWDAPSTGWLAGSSDAYGNCSLVTVYPAAGTRWLWMRRNHFPRVAEAVGPVTVT